MGSAWMSTFGLSLGVGDSEWSGEGKMEILMLMLDIVALGGVWILEFWSLEF